MVEEDRRESWEQELYYRHRWGDEFWRGVGQEERAPQEHARLKALWEAGEPWSEDLRALVDQINALELCNWRLEESILALCRAIGQKAPSKMPIGHMASMTDKRWRQFWAYYLSLRDWLPAEQTASQRKRSGYSVLLTYVDPGGAIQRHVSGLLGERTPLKELCVELFCLQLQRWLGGEWPGEFVQMVGWQAAVEALKSEIKKHEYDEEILSHIASNLQLCHVRTFHRYDIIVSSIGAGKWRAVMPEQGTGRAERYALMDQYLDPIEAWLRGERPSNSPVAQQVHRRLGQPDETKRFLASLLVSLLRSQQREEKLATWQGV